MELKSKLPDVGTSIFTLMSNLASEHKAINLAQGFPDFSIDPLLKEKVVEGLDQEQVQYAPMPGRLNLRKAIVDKMWQQHQKKFNPNTEITITSGATQAIYSTITALVSVNDEVIVFDPAYDCYDPTIVLQGAVPIHIPLAFPTYGINWQLVKEKIGPQTKMIIVNNPHNPTGSVLTKKDILALEELIEAHPDIYILSDEVYEHMQYTDEHQSVLKSKKLFKNSIVTYSFGKTFHVTGWKLGYAVAPENITTEIRKSHQFQVFSVSNTMQYAIAKYMESGKPWADVSDFYKAKRDLFLKEMEGSKLKPLPCNGTYFVLFDYSEISNESDIEFTKRITKEYKVATIPVSVFYDKGDDHKVIRVCFAKKDETLVEAAKILKTISI